MVLLAGARILVEDIDAISKGQQRLVDAGSLFHTQSCVASS